MKKLLFTLSMLLMCSLVFSQGFRDMDPEEIATRNTDELKSQLGLTDDQSEIAYKINLKTAKDMQKAFSDADGDRGAMRETMQKLRQKTDSSFQIMLTDYQFEQYKKIQEERMERRRQRREGGRP